MSHAQWSAERIATTCEWRAERQRSEGAARPASDHAHHEARHNMPEAPRPLRREPSPAERFPVEALGEVLGSAVTAIVDKIQCPAAIAAGSVLAAASLAAQAHADVILPATGRKRPLSLFVVTVAASGERKSAADYEALWPIRRREETLREAYRVELADYKRAKRAYDVALSNAEKTKRSRQAIEAALAAVGSEPQAPLLPTLTCDEPTVEGLHKLFTIGHPALGLFSDEGGTFIGGHAMREESKLRTAAALSSIWDGCPIKRVRAGDGATVLPGRRLATHLMAQPDAAARMLGDQVLIDQGLLSRILVSAPEPIAGTRLQRDVRPETEPALRRYGARLLDLLETPATTLRGNELDPRRLEFSEDAGYRWLAFADFVEQRLGPGGPLEPIRGFANKAAEHVARIAGVLAIIDDPQAQEISGDILDRAIALADFFTGEALRLFEAGACSPDILVAEKLLRWLRDLDDPVFSLACVYQRGPNAIREAATARRIIGILQEHGIVERISAAAGGKPPEIGGRRVREAWRLRTE